MASGSGPVKSFAAAAASSKAEDKVLKTVQLEGHVVLKILKHCRECMPALVTGQLLGLDVGQTLEVTDSFPFPVRLAPGIKKLLWRRSLTTFWTPVTSLPLIRLTEIIFTNSKDRHRSTQGPTSINSESDCYQAHMLCLSTSRAIVWPPFHALILGLPRFQNRGGNEDEEAGEGDGANYQLDMMRCLREVNVDNNTVGW